MTVRGRKKTDYARDLALLGTRQRWIALAIFLVVLALLPFIPDWSGDIALRGWLRWTNETIIIIIAVLGLNVITGMAGQVNLGHTAFIMVGGFTMAVLTTAAGWPMLAALPIAALLTGIIALFVALPAIRLKGFYVAIATLAFLYISQFIITQFDITGATDGLYQIPSPSFWGFKIKGYLRWYFFLMPFLILCIMISANISRSRIGRAFIAIRDNHIAAQSLGINVSWIKIKAFFIGGLFAGLAGGLLSSRNSVITTSEFTFENSIWYLGMIIIGGAGRTAGAVVGVISLSLIRQILSVLGSSGVIPGSSTTSIYITYTIYGLAIILFVSFKPLGLISIWHKIKLNYRRWPFGV
ncbi:MAG: branched-chain amino acid ABC transporter permease [Chloroflexi bacterium]|nr:branched-chain amino acid ABC transporter permease [Chloroflexota bacterium]MBT7080473.1 branched-chain amino acid ABC transporter permease [Chloroflexota bacterium]